MIAPKLLRHKTRILQLHLRRPSFCAVVGCGVEPVRGQRRRDAAGLEREEGEKKKVKALCMVELHAASHTRTSTYLDHAHATSRKAILNLYSINEGSLPGFSALHAARANVKEEAPALLEPASTRQPAQVSTEQVSFCCFVSRGMGFLSTARVSAGITSRGHHS